MLGLIDYDILCYRFAYSHEDTKDVQEVLEDVDLFINFLEMRLMLSDYKGFLTGDGNYREGLATIQPYKGNRDNAKPYWHSAIKEYLIDSHAGVVVDGMEADDAMGIESQLVEDSIICTIDKDLKMIPGMHYRWQHRETPESLFEVIEPEGMNFFYHQILTGDSGDHIPGLYKCTKTKASAKIKEGLNEAEDKEAYILKVWYAAHVQALADKGYQMDEESVWTRVRKEINEIGSLLWIQRKKGEIWTLST